MIIHLSPIRSNLGINLIANGDTLTINGDALDFSSLPEGGEYPPEAIDNEFVVGSVKRQDGEIHITIMLPYSNPDAPRSVTFPESVLVSVDGPVSLPEGRITEVEHAD